jgi:restriction endonuclease S subunit
MQRDIVNKLKPFDALLNAISNEIEARKKQYEHYLEKVLDFRAYKNGKEA